MRVAVLMAILAVSLPVGFFAGSASAEFFEGQSILGGRLVGPQHAWCSHQDTGADNVEEDCSFDSFEHCRWAVMGVNNSFCTPNPTYRMDIHPVRRKKGNRLKH
jgi:hypothetical protein